VSSNNRKYVKMLSAVIGGSAVVAMGALSAAIGQEQAGSDTIAKSTMQVGVTSTQTTPPTVEATSMAVPAMKGPAPLPSEQKAAE
jgi:hypothetical protein